jgi:hypothetical protein
MKEATFSKRFFKNMLLESFGDNPTTRRMLMWIDLSVKDGERITAKEYVKIFEPILK